MTIGRGMCYWCSRRVPFFNASETPCAHVDMNGNPCNSHPHLEGTAFQDHIQSMFLEAVLDELEADGG